MISSNPMIKSTLSQGQSFGHPLISTWAQADVHQVLATYQGADDFRCGEVPHPLAALNALPVGGGYQYHHVQIASHKVISVINQPAPVLNLTDLPIIPRGKCDL